ncbi:MAG: penicillin-binding protein 1C [Candidatus Delongbacteria bacterium]|nr:penicillin-binding protein 1C [Candidatus Delongbacteria bacterium]
MMRRRGVPFRLLLACLSLTLLWLGRPPGQLFREPWSYVLEDREGKLLGATVAADQQYRFPPGGSLPERYRVAVIQREDRRFLSHPGVDPLAVLRAMRQNLRAGEVVSGASTLTMQVIRLSQGNPPRTLYRKLQEAALAVRLELHASKQEILELYASHAPFGGNTVGLETAAWRYVGRPPHELSWAEAALFAMLPNRPSALHPGKRRNALREQRDRLLSSLAESGQLDSLELELAIAEPLPAAPRPFPRLAPHLYHTLQSRARLDPAQHAGEPPRLRSSLDLEEQRRTRAILDVRQQSLAAEDIANMAALVLDWRTGEIRAWVGNSGTGAGRDVDIIEARRSTGSLLKPLLYAARFDESALLPGSLVEDVPTHLGGYSPVNFNKDYSGALPAKDALIRSLNVPAVLQLKAFGAARFYGLLQDFGLGGLSGGPEHYGLTLILGSAEASLLELCTAYGILARCTMSDRGARFTPGLEPGGDPASRVENPLGRGGAWQALDCLADVTRPDEFGSWRRFDGAVPVYWKTGTSFGRRDGWAIGVTAERVVGVWAGNADGHGAAGLTGLGAAAPALFEILAALPAPATRLLSPTDELRPLDVCALSGMRASEVCPEHRSVLATLKARNGPRCTWHHWVWLDPVTGERVTADCALPDARVRVPWFVLPPDVESIYRSRHMEYRLLPAWRTDCRPEDPASVDPTGELSLIYPSEGARLLLPRGLDGGLEAFIFEAAHRREQRVLFWHLDGEFLGRTESPHRLSVRAAPGPHRLTIVSDSGERLSRRFTVLAR